MEKNVCKENTESLANILKMHTDTYLQNNRQYIKDIIANCPCIVTDCLGDSENIMYAPLDYGISKNMNWLVDLLLDYKSLVLDDCSLIHMSINPKIKIGTISKLIKHPNFSVGMLMYKYDGESCRSIINNKDLFFTYNSYVSKKCSETRRKKITNILFKSLNSETTNQ